MEVSYPSYLFYMCLAPYTEKSNEDQMKWSDQDQGSDEDLMKTTILYADKVIRHNPPLPGLLVHALHVLKHDQIDPNTKPMEPGNGALGHSNSSLNQLLLYDIIT